MNIEQLAKNYQPSVESIEVVKQTKIVLLSGIMSAGKNALVDSLLELPGYSPIVAHTTRPIRRNNGVIEVEGVNYNFVTFNQMAELLINKKLVEVNLFGHNYYGTSTNEFAKAYKEGLIALGDSDINGVTSINNIASDSLNAFFIIPPNFEVWIDRIKKRYGSLDTFNVEWQTRREITINELNKALILPHYKFIINDNLDVTAKTLDSIIKSKDINFNDEKAREVAKKMIKMVKRFY